MTERAVLKWLHQQYPELWLWLKASKRMNDFPHLHPTTTKLAEVPKRGKSVIFKYEIKLLADSVTVKMPDGAQILTAQLQGDTLCIWAVVNRYAPMTDRQIEIIGTGNPFIDDSRCYIATVQQPPWVWHIFERT